MKFAVTFGFLSLATTHSAAQFVGLVPDKPTPAPVGASEPTTDDVFLPILVDPDKPSDFPSVMSDLPSDVPSFAPSLLMASDVPSDLVSDLPSDVPSDAPSASPTVPFAAASVNASNILYGFSAASAASDVPSSSPSDAFSDVPSDVPSLMPSGVPSDAPSSKPSSEANDSLLPDDTVNNYTICGAWNESSLEQAEVSHSKYVYTLQLAAPEGDIQDTIHSVENLILEELMSKMCGVFTFAVAVLATPDDFATATCGDACYMLYGSVEIKSNTKNADELLELKCQAQRTIREMFIYREFDSVSQITEATLLYFDQEEELQCSTLNGNPNKGLVPSEQVTTGGESFVSEESSDDGVLTSGALVGLSFLGGTLIAAMVVGMHYKHTQRNARRNVNLTEEDLSMIIADV
ncbi:hypothetical protein FisN_19Lh122 [Fistulifera solaris]|uniref:Uncharacterized protein n=1 Tax=Fistulifera solaris TaxID=1519565 RepID=A0A1Z5J6N6_FISSO|nr:hypothetical protein FisN_19Lh122 [Fistulifera solaris]|eukprot:GAX09657.1 hypothetical protein FisN_19Lh122 [Fistulifera solaris]